MSALVQLDSLQLLASGVGADGKLSFDFPVMSPAIEDQVESCSCPYNTTGPSCQVSSLLLNLSNT